MCRITLLGCVVLGQVEGFEWGLTSVSDGVRWMWPG